MKIFFPLFGGGEAAARGLMLPLRTLFPGSYQWEVNFQEPLTRWVEMGDIKRAGMIFRLFKVPGNTLPAWPRLFGQGKTHGKQLEKWKKKNCMSLAF
jgi:hypothetical protein